MKRTILILALMLLKPCAGPAHAGVVTLAVAANFLTTAQTLAADFKAGTGHDVALVHGSTGKLYAQIVAGAPFDIFLAADAARPEKLVADGLVAMDGRRTYAFGRLALILRDAPGAAGLDDILRRDQRLAIADPATAPYGAAAEEVLHQVRGADWRRGVVFGESVGQAFAFVHTGNAPAGLVALSQTVDRPGFFFIPVPVDRYKLIRQDAVLLVRAEDNAAAQAFWAYLATPQARDLITVAGYGVAE